MHVTKVLLERRVAAFLSLYFENIFTSRMMAFLIFTFGKRRQAIIPLSMRVVINGLERFKAHTLSF